MIFRRLLAMFLLAGTLSSVSCAAHQPAKPDAATFQQAISAAETARKKAASVGGEWRDTGKLIKSAKATAKKGDYAKAIELANQARDQGDLGYQQAMEQKNVDLPSYLRE